MGEYLRTAGSRPLVPRERERSAALLDFFLLERALRELADDLDSRPDEVGAALQGLLEHLRDSVGAR
ncbi:hypothetical protein U7230_06700 [Carboxydochorda subterranea]|uniref:Uncharacterized protein n=1 Tax=Carboxydichorda subterranea TaxID=3109565 RepID=A0ABZ1C104_9FIRM|nr:hypothetical protein [Limnochorda sp. L945t]WRP18683.1 hypothetical protein U7230_06700 [Limnochorda sp. L945t]